MCDRFRLQQVFFKLSIQKRKNKYKYNYKLKIIHKNKKRKIFLYKKFFQYKALLIHFSRL